MKVFQGLVTLWISSEQFFLFMTYLGLHILKKKLYHLHDALEDFKVLQTLTELPQHVVDAHFQIIFLIYQVLVMFYHFKSRSNSIMKLLNHLFTGIVEKSI